MRRLLLTLGSVMLVANTAHASKSIPIVVRGQSLTVEFYEPAANPPKGTVLMASGDVGWVGLAVDLSEFLSSQGYAVVGINSRQYLAAFTTGKEHVTPDQVAHDYSTIVQFLRTHGTLASPIVLAGVSEGAGLAVLAGAPTNHTWAAGVITLGLPATNELAWRWKDALSWLTKKDVAEPSFDAKSVVGNVSPLPLWMIQSTHDEYVPEADYRQIDAAAHEPKRLVLIDAANHRFTNRLPEARRAVLAGLDWVQHQK